MPDPKYGILLQGLVNESTVDIINEYKTNFPYAHIILSTWLDQNTDDIPCEVVKSPQPPIPLPHNHTHNHQIMGTKEGLKKVKGEIIMRCRSEQFVHNSEIFEIYEQCCPKNKIMVPDLGTYETIEHRTSDFCQIATKELLLEFWNSIPPYDGSFAIDGGKYFTQNYVLGFKKDPTPWKIALRKYFCVKSYFYDFQIEWEKINKFGNYQQVWFNAFPIRAKLDNNFN